MLFTKIKICFTKRFKEEFYTIYLIAFDRKIVYE